MSGWDQWISNALINKTANGHTYNNVLTDACIVGHDGSVWASTTGIAVKPDEVKKLGELFNQSENNTPSIIIGGKKYQVTHYEKGAFVYLKIKEGGATIAKTAKAYVIGVYNTSKKYKYDGKELPQGVGMCNTVVEDLAAQFKGMNY